MTDTMTHMAQQLLVSPLLWLLFIGGVFSVAIGIGLVCFSSRVFSFCDRMNQWVSFRRALKPAAIPRDSWPFFERYRRWFALVFIVASIFSITHLITRIDAHQLGMLASSRLQVPPAFAEWIFSSVWWFLLIGSVLTIAVSVMLGFFPAALHKLDQQSGRWFSLRHTYKDVDLMYTPLDKLAYRYPRALGGLIVIAALANVIVVSRQLF